MPVVPVTRFVVVARTAENKQVPSEEKQNQRQFVLGEAA
jgi:hypothetical protein